MKNFVTIILLCLLTLGSYFFLKSLTKEKLEDTDSKAKFVVATATGVTARYFNKKNKLQYTLISPKLLEYSNHYGTEFKTPDLAVFDDNLIKTWQGNADKGTLSSDKDNLLLKKNVKIVEMPFGQKPTYIDGEVINYRAKKGLMTSNLPVRIDDGIMVQISDTLKLNTQTKKLNANKRVRARYKTRQKQESKE